MTRVEKLLIVALGVPALSFRVTMMARADAPRCRQRDTDVTTSSDSSAVSIRGAQEAGLLLS